MAPPKFKTSWRKPGQLKPYKDNPRHHTPDGIAKIAAAIEAFGWRAPIVVDESDVVIMGHGRLLAAQALGLESVPVHCAEGLSKQQVKALRIADNRVSEESRWDFDLLPLEMKELESLDFPMQALGFDGAELEMFLSGVRGIAGGAMPDQYDGAGLKQYTFNLTADQYDRLDPLIQRMADSDEARAGPSPQPEANVLDMAITKMKGRRVQARK